MKLSQSGLTILTLFICLAGVNPHSPSKDIPTATVFAGTTPCSQMIRPLHQIPVEADCALIKWQLTLNYDAVSLKPTTYKLSSVNRYIVKGTNMYSEPGTKTETEGKWIIINGTKRNPQAIVFQLEPGKPGQSISFLKLSDKLIHLLDINGGLMMGDASFSYTLSSIAN